jgi:hypothetical protein
MRETGQYSGKRVIGDRRAAGVQYPNVDAAQIWFIGAANFPCCSTHEASDSWAQRERSLLEQGTGLSGKGVEKQRIPDIERGRNGC